MPFFYTMNVQIYVLAMQSQHQAITRVLPYHVLRTETQDREPCLWQIIQLTVQNTSLW